MLNKTEHVEAFVTWENPEQSQIPYFLALAGDTLESPTNIREKYRAGTINAKQNLRKIARKNRRGIENSLYI